MKKSFMLRQLTIVIILSCTFLNWSCQRKEHLPLKPLIKPKKVYAVPAFDSTLVSTFFEKYTRLAPYKNQVVQACRKQEFHYMWYDKKGKKEAATVLNDKLNHIADEGIETKVPYKKVFDTLFNSQSVKPNTDVELFLTAYYFYYTDKVFRGIDDSKSNAAEWFLPRKKPSYVKYLDSLLIDPEIIEKPQMVGQYYKLKDYLKKYRAIENQGGWEHIVTDSTFKELKPGDSSGVIGQIRKRLFITGELANDSKSNIYDSKLRKAVIKFKKRNGFALDNVILEKHIAQMNVPVSERIKTIIVNMERCRWVADDASKEKELITINIPSFKLTYFKNGEVVLVSNVVVGSDVNKTVIFSGMMSSIVFSPYWNLPQSIIKNEILPAIEKDSNYLEEHDMEWNDGNVRQKPGPKNSLGLVKFLFPNNNNIYLHDTPSKSLFYSEARAFSHGCIRVAKPKELANLILEEDPDWTPEKIEESMNGGKEVWCKLKEKIPVYIGYFTAWVDENGNLYFYRDIYNRDQQLADLLME